MKYAINLFPHSSHNSIDRLRYFGTHYLRFVLIFTQLIVIGVFMFRFSFDQQIVDEKQKLAQKLAIIEATKPLRADLEKKQTVIKQIQSIFSAQDTWKEQVAYVRSIFPKNASLTRLTLDTKTVQLSGSTDTRMIVQQLFQKLTNDKKFKSVKLDQFTRDINGKYQFAILMEGYQTPIKNKKS
ncbi:MAG: PilN domain-containing protein [Candidatus Roizmanbacteria bacterium]